MARRGFGEVERRKNARTGKTTGYRARYWGPNLERYSRSFTTKQDAEAWLASEESLIARGTWTAPPLREAARAARAITVAEYAMAYIQKREAAGRAPKTIQEYRRYVARFIDGDPIGKAIVPEVTREDGEAWHLRLLEATGMTMAGRVYSLLSSVFNEAQRAGLVTVHPLQVKGAGNPPRQSAVTSATPAEVAKIAAGMPEQVRVAIYVMAYCGLRISEMRGLRRGDVDTERGVIHVRQQVQQIVGKGKVARKTKTTASNSTAPLPSDVAELIDEHMSRYTRESRDALVFTSATGSAVNLSKFYRQFKKAREGAGRPDLRVHDLRHTFAMLNVTEGKADVRTVQRLLRQSSPAAALRYQHAAASAVEDSASRLNSLIVPIPETVEETPRHLRAV